MAAAIVSTGPAHRSSAPCTSILPTLQQAMKGAAIRTPEAALQRQAQGVVSCCQHPSSIYVQEVAKLNHTYKHADLGSTGIAVRCSPSGVTSSAGPKAPIACKWKFCSSCELIGANSE